MEYFSFKSELLISNSVYVYFRSRTFPWPSYTYEAKKFTHRMYQQTHSSVISFPIFCTLRSPYYVYIRKIPTIVTLDLIFSKEFRMVCLKPTPVYSINNFIFIFKYDTLIGNILWKICSHWRFSILMLVI